MVLVLLKPNSAQNQGDKRKRVHSTGSIRTKPSDGKPQPPKVAKEKTKDDQKEGGASIKQGKSKSNQNEVCFPEFKKIVICS